MEQKEEQLLRYADLDPQQLSPMMRQVFAEKEKRPDCLLLFRLGDFFELFFDDALLVSRELSLTLTRRDCGLEQKAPMCGVPHHAAETYIARLVEKGYKVAICEQTEDPAQAKGMVKREVVRVVTPGTTTHEASLDEKAYRYVLSVYQQEQYFGLAAADLSAGRFLATEFLRGATLEKLKDEVTRYRPVELICNQFFFESAACRELKNLLDFSLSLQDDESFSPEKLSQFPQLEFAAESLWGRAAAALFQYIEETQFRLPEQMEAIQPYYGDHYMLLDDNARRHLEISQTLRDGSRRGSLLWVLDRCRTSMGSRLLKQWLEQPLMNIRDIEQRLCAVGELRDSFLLRQELRELLGGIYDLERLAGKIALEQANPRDLYSLIFILDKIAFLPERLSPLTDPWLTELRDCLDPLPELAEILRKSIADEAPVQLKEGGIFREGAHAEIDSLRHAALEGRQWILDLEGRERERTGIKTLKIRYNRVFGYAIEITHANRALVPEDYERKQTLANSERYVTEELKRLEASILGAEQKLLALEYELFLELRSLVARSLPSLRENARALAALDLLASLAETAERENYCRPLIKDDDSLEIINGRHPVVEKMLKESEFVPNDLSMNRGARRMMVLTGPNMAGKSTYMRQNALIILLAQMGSFVPADAARVGICDRIFTRVGASDDLGSGQSTFMVEMSEVAQILRQASSKSFLILDEIGRGTSTWDGMSIAWSVIEHVADRKWLGCRSLFATHYHELTELEKSHEGVFNCHVQVREEGQEVVFLHRIIEGGSDDSYGIEVAKLAGVPDTVVARARELLLMLEQENQGRRLRIRRSSQAFAGQIDLFTAARDHREQREILEQIDKAELNLMRPLDALTFLEELQIKTRRILPET